MQPEEQKYFYSFWAARTLDEGLLAVRNGCFLHKWQWGPTQFSLPIFISSQNTVSDQHSIRHPSHWLESEKSSTSPNEAASFTFIYWNKVSCLHVHRAISSFGGWPTPRVFLPSCMHCRAQHASTENTSACQGGRPARETPCLLTGSLLITYATLA